MENRKVDLSWNFNQEKKLDYELLMVELSTFFLMTFVEEKTTT